MLPLLGASRSAASCPAELQFATLKLQIITHLRSGDAKRRYDDGPDGCAMAVAEPRLRPRRLRTLKRAEAGSVPMFLAERLEGDRIPADAHKIYLTGIRPRDL